LFFSFIDDLQPLLWKANVVGSSVFQYFVCMGNGNYEIKPARELLSLETTIGVKSTFQDTETYAHIYELLNGQFILLPAVGSKGLLIYERSTLDKILSTRIPIEDEHHNPHLEKQDLIISLPYSAPLAIEKINEALKTNIDVKELDFDVEDLNKKVKKFGCLKAYEELSIELGILLCEVLRTKENGLEYKFEKRYGYNPYFEAVLIDKDGAKISPWYYLNRYLIEKKRFNFGEIQEKTEHFRL
jgi:hypothetical protein